MKHSALMVGTLLLLSGVMPSAGQVPYRWEEGGAVRFSGLHGQVEVGGPFVGMEFHESRPLPSRISFYYPVANSIDLSTDYWKRGASRPFLLGVKVDRTPRRWLGKEPWEYVVAPHFVRFERSEADLHYSLQYDFCGESPAAVIVLTIRNVGSSRHDLELYTHLNLSLRSCQTYARFNADRTRYANENRAVIALYDALPLARCAVLVQNAGIAPVSWTVDAGRLSAADSGWSNWIDRESGLDRVLSGAKKPAVAAFAYEISLSPGDSTQIVQVVGSTRRDEVGRVAQRLAGKWREDVRRYRDRVLSAMRGDRPFASGDAWVDSSVTYARALLAANRHYLDGDTVPMPCPAEYNFFFTHDVLQTDLSAIAFDPLRVRQDLLYIARRARNQIIPHAYYWKDDRFRTEYCSAGNWNHALFILASAAYLRRTMDSPTVLRLYPLMKKSLGETLTRRKGGVMLGFEPDWWDFGRVEGKRAYLTILSIRAIEEFVFVASFLGKDLSALHSYEQVADSLRAGLVAELWDPQEGYLLNTIADRKDRHIYMGPLLAPAYGILPPAMAQRLVATARGRLLNPTVGIRTVAPADFHTDSVKQLFHVKANEAGDPYLYANGGIWYLGNAWYARALRSVGEVDAAFDFYRRTMTIDGILRSPRGQPALYEYRFADTSAPDHGWVDKPTMMWAAGFCVGEAYRFIGFDDNVWNVSVGGAVPSAIGVAQCAFTFGSLKQYERKGRGTMVTRVTVDGQEIPSRVLPLNARKGHSVVVEQGPIRFPYLDSVNAVVHAASLDPAARTMKLTLSSFPGHRTVVKIITPWMGRSVSLNGEPWRGFALSATPLGTLIVTVLFPASSHADTLTIAF